MCYNGRMDNILDADLLSLLRRRLEPVARVPLLVDQVEGQRPGARRAAVLLPIFEREGELHLLFIRRAQTLRNHGGEIAFPGGSSDAGDNSAVTTALREAWEEVGLDPALVSVLGVLPPVFTVVSNFLITPVVAFLPTGPGSLQRQPDEVDELLFLPLRGLADPRIAYTEEWTRQGQTRTVYFYDYGPYHIWGATARILNQLLALLPQGAQMPPFDARDL